MEEITLTTEQKKLANAIYLDFIKTYPECTYQMVEDEMEYQMNTGCTCRKGILSTWIDDYLQRSGYWDTGDIDWETVKSMS